MILPGQRIHARKVVDALVGFHFVKTVYSDTIVCPKDIPFVLLVVAVFVALTVSRKTHVKKLLSNVSNYLILSLRNVKHQFLSFVLNPLALFLCFLCLISTLDFGNQICFLTAFLQLFV